MRGHSSILIIYFCFFRMADHEVISYWKLGHTINVINGLSETADGGEKKKKEEYQKSCPVHVQQDKTASKSWSLLDCFFLKITTCILWR